MLRSLITAVVSPAELSIMYSISTILHVVADPVVRPLCSSIFSVGIRLGGAWIGLPFIMGGVIVSLSLPGMHFLKEKERHDSVD